MLKMLLLLPNILIIFYVPDNYGVLLGDLEDQFQDASAMVCLS